MNKIIRSVLLLAMLGIFSEVSAKPGAEKLEKAADKTLPNMSEQGVENTNSKKWSEQSRGQDRAEERRSRERDDEQAGEAHEKKIKKYKKQHQEKIKGERMKNQDELEKQVKPDSLIPQK